MDMKCVIFNKIVFHDVARWLETWVKDDIVVVLGYHAAPAGCTIEHVRADNPGKKIVVYQLEQLYDGSPVINGRCGDWLKKADEVWEFDLGNKAYMEKYGFYPKYVPLSFTDRTQVNMRRPEDRDIDILFVGFPSTYRLQMLQLMMSRFQYRFTTILGTGVSGLMLDELISRSKIFLNIHANENYHCQEQVRLFRAVSGGCCVVSERSPFNEFGKSIVECGYHEIGPTCRELLKSGDWQKIAMNASETYRAHCQNRKKV